MRGDTEYFPRWDESQTPPPASSHALFTLREFFFFLSGGSQVLGVYVSLVMLRQVVAPHEAFLTLAALEALVSCEGKKDGLLEFCFKSLNTNCSCLSVGKQMVS